MTFTCTYRYQFFSSHTHHYLFFWTSMSKTKPKHPPKIIFISLKGNPPLAINFPSDQNMDSAYHRMSPIMALASSIVVFVITCKENMARLLESNSPLLLFQTHLKCNCLYITLVTYTSQTNHLSTHATHLRRFFCPS